MYQKFIINQHGVLRFGKVMRHYQLLRFGEQCPYGGGWWEYELGTERVMLYGHSTDFGHPDFDFLKRVDWDSLDGKEHPLIYLSPGEVREVKI
ncbi:MAG: hypothetical protein MJZ67_04695 [Bacteroidales bacterium]|nr:hypothetical protein [Bacteroidales bacterium]